MCRNLSITSSRSFPGRLWRCRPISAAVRETFQPCFKLALQIGNFKLPPGLAKIRFAQQRVPSSHWGKEWLKDSGTKLGNDDQVSE
jgi:hypothetical protein